MAGGIALLTTPKMCNGFKEGKYFYQPHQFVLFGLFYLLYSQSCLVPVNEGCTGRTRSFRFSRCWRGRGRFLWGDRCRRNETPAFHSHSLKDKQTPFQSKRIPC